MPKDKVIKYTDSKGRSAHFILEKKIGAGVFGKSPYFNSYSKEKSSFK